MVDIFHVVADATRRDLLTVLLDRASAHDSAGSGTGTGSGAGSGEISVGEIVEKLGLSQPTVSKHLKVLRDNGLVSVREEGQHRYYTIDTSPLEELEDWLIPFLSADLDAVDGAGSAVFAAWSGAAVPQTLRRAAGTLQNPGDAGLAIGRRAAEATVRLQDASHEVERRVIDPLKKRLGR